MATRRGLIGGAMRQLDTAMENASAGHLAANRNFAQASRDIEAVQTGRDAAMRGRTEDTIPAFQGLTREGQEAFRSGYVDPLIAQTQGAAFGVNKARPLLNDAFADGSRRDGARQSSLDAAAYRPRTDDVRNPQRRHWADQRRLTILRTRTRSGLIRPWSATSFPAIGAAPSNRSFMRDPSRDWQHSPGTRSRCKHSFAARCERHASRS